MNSRREIFRVLLRMTGEKRISEFLLFHISLSLTQLYFIRNIIAIIIDFDVVITIEVD